MIKILTWYTDRSISQFSLGGLLILVVNRTIQIIDDKDNDPLLDKYEYQFETIPEID